MASQLFAICFNATQPSGLARFWSGVLGCKLADGQDGDVAILPSGAAGFRIRFLPSQEPKIGENRAHFDLTSTSPEDQRQTVARALQLGGKHIDVGQLPEEGHVVLADPDGNEFCVIEAGNTFLADTGFIGALACDGTQEVGYFWSEAPDPPHRLSAPRHTHHPRPGPRFLRQPRTVPCRECNAATSFPAATEPVLPQ
jgi:catechol 2,3-dioxygenase-like lactoylglutathione lyase family enzyme